jgi:hypothetical protein
MTQAVPFQVSLSAHGTWQSGLVEGMLASYSQALGQAGSVAAMSPLNGQAVTQVLPTNTCPVGQELGTQLSPSQVSLTAQASWQSGLVEGILASYSQALGQAGSVEAMALLKGQALGQAGLVAAMALLKGQALGQAGLVAAMALLNGQAVKHAPLINTCPVGQEVITQVVPFQVSLVAHGAWQLGLEAGIEESYTHAVTQEPPDNTWPTGQETFQQKVAWLTVLYSGAYR